MQGIVDRMYSEIPNVMGKHGGDIDQTSICRTKLPYKFASGTNVSWEGCGNNLNDHFQTGQTCYYILNGIQVIRLLTILLPLAG